VAENATHTRSTMTITLKIGTTNHMKKRNPKYRRSKRTLGIRWNSTPTHHEDD
jgi:hypothetical protein